MISIKFSPKYEDRVSIFLKNATHLKDLGITYDFKETPQGENDYLCYWLFDYRTSVQVNSLLIALTDLKEIMGIDDLEFQYIHNEKDFYTQSNKCGRVIPWFKV